MKRGFYFVILIALLMFLTPFTVQASILPTSSIELQIKGIEGEYKIELLIEALLPNQDVIDELKSQWEDAPHPIPSVLFELSVDGYISKTLYGSYAYDQETNQNTHVFRNLVKQDYRVILIWSDESYVVSPILSSLLYNAKMTWDLTGVVLTSNLTSAGTIKEIFPIWQIILDFFIRISVPLAVTMLVLFAFRYQKSKNYQLVLIVNVITQMLLAVALLIVHYLFAPGIGEYLILFFSYFFIVLIHSFIYTRKLEEQNKTMGYAIWYAFIGNILAIIVALFLVG